MALPQGLVRRGMRVAVADGFGSPRELLAPLAEAAVVVGDVDLVLGWTPVQLPELDLSAFRTITTAIGGPGLRAGIEAGRVRRLPSRLSAVPALLAGPLRPDLLLATLVPGPGGLRFGTEVSWMRGLAEAGVPVAAVLSEGFSADAGRRLPAGDVQIIAPSSIPSSATAAAPAEITVPPPTATDRAIARHVAALVPEGARVQTGPGRLAAAMLAALDVPVRIDSGMLPEAVVDLDERGLLLGVPVATYLAGTRRLYAWADGRRILHPIEIVHDVGRLAASGLGPLIALNTALELDVDGQVNVEGSAAALTGMIGGHPDFAAAGARSVDGLSVIALPGSHRGRATLVRRLSRPVTTPAHDVDVVVTERSAVDLRGLDRAERRAALLDLWGLDEAAMELGDTA